MKIREIIAVISILCFVVVVNASINLYFGEINTELSAKQPITIDGNLASDPINHELDVWCGANEAVKHKIINKGNIDANISQITTGLVEGIELVITYKNGSVVLFPFVLNGKDKTTLIFTYYTDMNLEENTYLIQTCFSCEKT